jgi:5-formyltetrahydrofolate cyclo-ligase
MATLTYMLDPPHPQSALIAARLLELEAVQKGRSVSIYLSMPSKEVPTYPIIDRLFASSPPKELFVPKVSDLRVGRQLGLPHSARTPLCGPSVGSAGRGAQVREHAYASGSQQCGD